MSQSWLLQDEADEAVRPAHFLGEELKTKPISTPKDEYIWTLQSE